MELLTMKELPLRDGIVAWVDECDYPLVSSCKWTLDRNGYVVRKSGGRKVLLHRQILNAPQGLDVDHVNRNPLDNRRSNLRICTRSQNSINRGPKPGASSKYKGVCWHSKHDVWVARICQTWLGSFPCETDAALAYDEAARTMFGEFAHLNFPDSSDPGRI